jgi:MFS family permease
MSTARAPLFTPRFVVMCGFSFTVFLSAFQLFPVAPFRVLDLGGTTFAAGLFLGALTYASAFSAPFTGFIADRVGRRRQLVVASGALALLSTAYAFASRPSWLLAIAVGHGVFWSALLSANAAYTTDLIPADRRAEGIGYHGLASVLAVAVAPSVGLWLYRGGWVAVCVSIAVLNTLMAIIAWHLPDDRHGRGTHDRQASPVIEWHVTLAAVTLFLGAVGYGGVTSFVAIMADRAGLSPRGLYFTVLALTIVASRPVTGRLADRVGTAAVLVPCLLLAAAGYAMLALPTSHRTLIPSAVLVGLGFGSAYPVFAAWVLSHVGAASRGAAFGGILAALDTGIGSGSIAVGWIASHYGVRVAFGLVAVLALAAAPYFLILGRRAVELRPRGGPPGVNGGPGSAHGASTPG